MLALLGTNVMLSGRFGGRRARASRGVRPGPRPFAITSNGCSSNGPLKMLHPAEILYSTLPVLTSQLGPKLVCQGAHALALGVTIRSKPYLGLDLRRPLLTRISIINAVLSNRAAYGFSR